MVDLEPLDGHDLVSDAHAAASLRPQAGAGGHHGRSTVMDRVDNLAGIDSLEADRCDPEVCMSELALDDRWRDPFVCHLDRVRVTWLVRREPPPHTGLGREPA